MTCSGRDCYVDANQENIIKYDLLGYNEAYLDFEEIDRQDVDRAWRIRWNLNDQLVVRTGERWPAFGDEQGGKSANRLGQKGERRRDGQRKEALVIWIHRGLQASRWLQVTNVGFSAAGPELGILSHHPIPSLTLSQPP